MPRFQIFLKIKPTFTGLTTQLSKIRIGTISRGGLINRHNVVQHGAAAHLRHGQLHADRVLSDHIVAEQAITQRRLRIVRTKTLHAQFARLARGALQSAHRSRLARAVCEASTIQGLAHHSSVLL
jgi:hypothetical protein